MASEWKHNVVFPINWPISGCTRWVCPCNINGLHSESHKVHRNRKICFVPVIPVFMPFDMKILGVCACFCEAQHYWDWLRRIIFQINVVSAVCNSPIIKPGSSNNEGPWSYWGQESPCTRYFFVSLFLSQSGKL